VAGARIDRKFQVIMAPRYGLPMVLHAPDEDVPRTRVTGNIHEMVDLVA
jgi:hypothetical protein